MTYPSIKEIHKGFPHDPNLHTMTTAHPSYGYIKKIHNQQMKANAASQHHSSLGGGQHGLLLGLVLSPPPAYHQLTGTPFQLPVNPGDGLDLVNGNPNGPEVAQHTAQYYIFIICIMITTKCVLSNNNY